MKRNDSINKKIADDFQDFELSLQEYIKSGEYFKDAQHWYYTKYIYIMTYRSILLVIAGLVLFAGSILALSGYFLFPIKQQVRYSVNTPGTYQAAVSIIPANQIKNDALGSIADIMVKNYVKVRESYSYDELKKQFTFLKNNSTRIVFRKFFNFMNIDNPDSPIIKYQKFTRRSINIISVRYPSPAEAVVTFEAIAKVTSGEVTEHSIWEAELVYEIDKLDLSTPSGSRFNFAVTNYKPKVIQDKLMK
jgi:type IV secretion system protein VirB8